MPKLRHALPRMIGSLKHKGTLASMNDPEITVALITDAAYMLPTLVTIYSLARSNRKNRISVRLLTIGLSLPSGFERMFTPLINEKFQIHITNLHEATKEFAIGGDFHVSPAAIAKFRLANLFPNLSKILYMDGDILVTGDLETLWNEDISNHYGAFVKDIKPVIKYRQNRLTALNIEDHAAYFNSGVMLLNLERMRQDNVEEKLFSYRKNGLNNFMDQDALNVILGAKAKFVDLRHNFLVTLLDEFDLPEINAHYGTQFTESNLRASNFAHIIHFCSPEKPWNSSRPAFSHFWRECLLDYLREYSHLLPPQLAPLAFYNSIVVSLTSYGSRVQTVHQVILELKAQTLQPHKIILWLAEDEFQGNLDNLPASLTTLQDDQFEIKFCKDIKSYKKLVPTLESYANHPIATADDDQIYNENWLWELFLSWLTLPDGIHCHRGHKVTFCYGQVDNYAHWLYNHKQKEASQLIFPTGCGGIFYPPHCFSREIFNEKMFMAKCPSGDDIWFWAMGLMKNRKFRIVPNSTYSGESLEGTQETALFKQNIGEHGNDEMLRQIIFYYPFIKKYLFTEYYGEWHTEKDV